MVSTPSSEVSWRRARNQDSRSLRSLLVVPCLSVRRLFRPWAEYIIDSRQVKLAERFSNNQLPPRLKNKLAGTTHNFIPTHSGYRHVFKEYELGVGERSYGFEVDHHAR